MLTGIGGRRLYVGRDSVDLRKGFDGLSLWVRERLGREPMDGSVYILFNRRRTQVRLLFFEAGGYWVCGKRLEAGTFAKLHPNQDGGSVELSAAEMSMLLEGLEAPKVVRRKRYGEKAKRAA